MLTKKSSKSTSKAKYLKKKGYWKRGCFNLVSEIVIFRDGRCIETNTTEGLQGAHIISKSYKATAWDLDNVVALNFKRHKFYTYRPLEWKEFINKHFGEGYYEELEKRALVYKSWSLEELKELYERLEAYRNTFDRRTGKFPICANPGRGKSYS